MDDIRKYELDRVLQRLRNAINNTDRQLLEELPTDGDPEQVRLRINARHRALTTLHFILTSEINSSSSTWELAMQSALTVEDEQVRRALINEYQTHWATSGGVEAENTIHELILLVEAALHLLPQENNATIEMTPARPRTYTGSRSNPVLTQRVAFTSGESLPQRRERHPEGDSTSEELVQASTDLNKPAVAPTSLPQPMLLPHSLQEQLVRLPKFDLPVFTGDIATFGEFWDVFDSAVHSNSLIPPTVKFHYLRSSLRDDALALVAGYSITDTNYELAINTLRETYFRPTFMRVQLSRKLEQFRPASSSPISQRITLAQIKSIWLQLKKLGEHDSNVFVMRIIRDKFPSRTLEYVGHQGAQDAATWGVSQLLDALDSSIKTFEAIEDSAQRRDTQLHTLALQSTSRSPSREPSPNTSRRRQVSRSPSRTRRSEPSRGARCAFCCSPQHYTHQCGVAMNVQARRHIAQDYRLCFRCLSSFHTVDECWRPPCSICQDDHHSLLCWKATKYLYRAPYSRSPSRSSRSPSRDGDGYRRENLPSERGRSLDALINITRSFQLLRDTIENAILQIGQLSLILEQVDPWGASFAVITLWINELMHNLTAISVHRDVIQEEILPFIAEPQPQRIAVAAILRERGLSSTRINTLLMRASAVSAHLTRFIRSLDALRVSQLATLGKGDPAAKNFVAECQAQSPGGFPTSILTYMNTLKWWRDHYVSEFDSTAAREFRKLSCEQATELVKQVKPPAPTTSSDTKPKFKSGWIIPHKEPTPTVMRSEGVQPQSSSQLSVHYRSPSPPPPPAQHLSRGWEAGSHLGSRSQSRGRRKNRKRRKGTSRNWYGDVQRGRYEDSPMVQSPDSTFESPDIPPIRRQGLPPVPPQMAPRPGQPPCVFCSSKDHYSAECHVRRHLNTRVDLLVENQICSICLRRHYGECVRADGCGICGEPTHHQAICIQNAFTINDIASTAPRFYKNAAEASFIPVPPGHQQRRPHSRPRERSRPPGRRTQRGPDNTLSDSSRPSGSRGRF